MKLRSDPAAPVKHTGRTNRAAPTCAGQAGDDTGDSDFIAAMKLARKEGLRIYLETMNHPVYVELKVHADVLL